MERRLNGELWQLIGARLPAGFAGEVRRQGG